MCNLPEIVLEAQQIRDRAEDPEGFRFEGYYAVTIYKPDNKDPLTNLEEWRHLLDILQTKCGTKITTLKIVQGAKGSDYIIQLEEN